MTSVENMLAVYNATPADSMLRSIIRRILVNLEDVGKMTIYDLADTCYTSPASISRLVKKLGYKNYSYFQKDIVDCVSKYDHHNRFIPSDSVPENVELPHFFMDTLEEILSNLRKNLDLEEIRSLVHEIHASEKISVYSYTGYFAEMFLQSDIFMTGKICDVFQQESEMLGHTKVLTKKDLVILMAPKCIHGLDAERLIDAVHENGARVCIIANSKHVAGFKKADIQFLFEGTLHSMDMFALQAFLCMVDMEYRRIYIDEK